MTFDKIISNLKQPHVIFILIALFAGLAFIKLTPPLWGLDEQAHFGRVFHALRGEFISTQDKDDRANTIPDNVFELYQHRTRDILDVEKKDTVYARQDVTDPGSYETVTRNKFTNSESFFPFIANYTVLAYPGPILGLALANLFQASMGDSLFLMRLFSLFSYILIGAVSIWLVKKYKIKWLFLAVALIPTAIFQASVITADTMLLGTLLLFFALLYRVLQDKKPSRALFIALGIVSLVIPLMKLNYIFVVLSVLAIPSIKFSSYAKSYIFKILTSIGAVLLVVIWSLISRVTATPEISQRGDGQEVIPIDQIVYAVTNPIEFVVALIRSFIIHGDMYYQGLLFTISGNTIITPLILTVGLSIALLAAALIAKDEIRKIKRPLIWIILGCLTMTITVFGALYAAFSPVGYPFVDGVQGRYFLPALLPVLMFISLLIPVDIKKPSRYQILLVVLTSIIALLISVLYVRMALY